MMQQFKRFYDLGYIMTLISLLWPLGDNIFGFDATNAVASMNAAFAPAISSRIPWAAVLGNHDQESTLSREGVMKYISGMNHTLSKLNPNDFHVIDGFGNYNLEVHGFEGSSFVNKSVLNLYFLDSGDYSTVPDIPGYGWIKPSQQYWFQQTSKKLQVLITSITFYDFSVILIGEGNDTIFLFSSMYLLICHK